ncbi:MAG: aspartate aminotransferase family protein [Rhodospirillaceae bacterium]|nr:aspartate aminotransferase family protein [Rhodospirillaceae bacterium]
MQHSIADTAPGSDLSALWRRAAELGIGFRAGIADRPQRPQAGYHEMREAFAAPTPEDGAPAAQVIEDLARLAEPGLHAMTGPRFFGWVIGSSHPAGVAADWLTSAWGQNCGNHHATPAAAAVEEVAARWLLDLLRLPADCSVGFVTGATIASFVGLAAARSEVLRRAGWDVEAKGLFGAPEIRVLIGDDAHTSVFSALQFLGLGHDRVVRVATDRNGRIDAAAFARAVAAGEGPLIAIAQAGQLNTGAIDPVAEMAPLVQAQGGWLHVDGAFALWARACPETAALAEGLELADSWATDGHKWLQTPYDCGYAITRHPEAHRRAMTIAASYLPAAEAGDRDPSHYVPELSRRARGFATWAIIKTLGRAGIAEMVGRHCRLARRMAATLGATSGITILNDVTLNQVILSFGAGRGDEAGDRLTQQVIETIQRDGALFAGGARWRGRWVMRLSVISGQMTEADADRATAAILKAWDEVRGDNA